MGRDKTVDEKRNTTRIPKTVPVTVRIVQYPLEDAERDHAMMKNMADQGICFQSSRFYERNTFLSLDIDLRGWQNYLHSVSSIVDVALLGRPFTAIATVVWSNKAEEGSGYETGVCFTNVYEDDFLAFQKYLKKINERLQGY